LVDIWHCDASGVHSGFDAGERERVLRGTQVTNADGVCEFTTVYPGWYQGRTVHTPRSTSTADRPHHPALLRRRRHRQGVRGRAVLRAKARDQRNDTDGIFDPRSSSPLSAGATATAA
jgi:protocatechuate 3,4-dioxygenase beta subunit